MILQLYGCTVYITQNIKISGYEHIIYFSIDVFILKEVAKEHCCLGLEQKVNFKTNLHKTKVVNVLE